MAHIYQEIESAIAVMILNGRLPAGAKAPSIRELCVQFGVAKGTAMHALQRLEARGMLEARPRSGFYVSRRQLRPAPVEFNPAPVAVRVSEVLLDIMHAGAAFDLTPGAGDSPATGLDVLNRYLNRAIRQQRGQQHRYYDSPAGIPELREQVAIRLRRRGCQLMADDICITSGCQNSLFLALMATCRPGDVVAVESPGFYGALQLLEQLQLKVIEIPSLPGTGMQISALEEAASRWNISACVVAPCFSTPAGAVMPENERQQLLALASRYDFAIIEDDIYADTALGVIPDPLKCDDQEGRVILCSSFSKSLSRDLRLGWISGGRWQQNILQLKLVTQLASPITVQSGLASFVADGHYTTHLKRQQLQLRQQRDFLVKEVASWPLQRMPEIPDGGLTLWLEFNDRICSRTLFEKLRHNDILVTPGLLFSNENKYGHHLRLSYAHAWNGRRRDALMQIQKTLQQLLRDH